MLLQVLYSVRSERQLVEQINYNLLFRWFVGLSIEDAVWNHSVFSKNRDQMIEHDVVIELFNATVDMAKAKDLLSGEHFSVDGTQIKAWASHKSMRRKDSGDDGRDPEDWRGERRSNEIHESRTDPDSQFYRKSNAAPALPSFLRHIATDNRHGLVVNVQTMKATGTAECDAAAVMLGEIEIREQRITVGADKAYDTRGFVRAFRHIDGRTTRHIDLALEKRTPC